MDLRLKCQGFHEAREAFAKGVYPYFRVIEHSDGTTVCVGGKRLVMVGSSDYLGLTHHPRVIEAARAGLEEYGSSCTGSPLLCGTLDLHKRLESQLAQFFRREAALLFPTGYQAQLGVISALAGPRDVVFSDRHNHASLVDGCRLAPARVRKYRHADMADLERLLARTDPGNGKLIVTDGVFSMAGALAPLQDIVKLARTYQAAVLLDDAHGLGVLGDTGRGTAERFAVESEVDVIAGTFSKSLASAGGFVVGDEEVIHYLKHHARPCIFSASIPPASVAAALAALDIIEQEPDRRTRLRKNTCYTVDNLRALGYETGNSETPIIPVILRERMKTAVFAQSLLEQGVFANPIISPAVASGQELIRISFTADHTKDQLDTVLGAFCSVGRDLGVI